VAAEPRWWRWLAWAALFVGVALRAQAWLVEPVLPFEDGTLLFARSYAEPRLTDWVAEYAGYVPFGSNVAAWLMCRLETSCIPTAFVLLAVVLHTCAAASVLHPDARGLAPFRVRLAIAGCAAWLPLGSAMVCTTLSYVQWSMLWWLLVALVRQSGANRAARWRHGLLVAVLTFWHPLALTLLPLLLLPALRRGRREVAGCFVAAALAYLVLCQLVVTESPATDWSRLSSVPYACVVRVGLESVCGYDLRPWLTAEVGPWAVWAAGLSVCGGWLLLVRQACRRWTVEQRTFVWAACWLGVMAVAVAAVRREELDPEAFWPVRYYRTGRLAFLVVATLALARLWARPWWLALVVAAGGCVSLVGAERYRGHEGGGDAVRAFLVELRSQELERGGRRWIRARLVKRNGWGILIQPR